MWYDTLVDVQGQHPAHPTEQAVQPNQSQSPTPGNALAVQATASNNRQVCIFRLPVCCAPPFSLCSSTCGIPMLVLARLLGIVCGAGTFDNNTMQLVMVQLLNNYLRFSLAGHPLWPAHFTCIASLAL